MTQDEKLLPLAYNTVSLICTSSEAYIVAVCPDVYLVAAIDALCRSPTAAILVRTGVGIGIKRISYPHGRIPILVVQVGVVAGFVRSSVGSCQERAPGGGAGQLKPPRSVTGVIGGVSSPGGSASGFSSFVGYYNA